MTRYRTSVLVIRLLVRNPGIHHVRAATTCSVDLRIGCLYFVCLLVVLCKYHAYQRSNICDFRRVCKLISHLEFDRSFPTPLSPKCLKGDKLIATILSASGLGQATARHLHSLGGYIAILDLNEDNGQQMVQELAESGAAGNRAKFFQVDVSSTESVAQAVKMVVEWVSSTSKEIGGVVAAAGVGNPGKVRLPRS